MNKKLGTVLLVASLEKAARKTKSAFWNDLAERLSAPSRHNVVVNLFELDKMAQKFKGKTLVVPGKILGKGVLTEKVVVSAESVSSFAKEEISKKGKFVSLKDLADSAEKVKTSDLVIVK